MEITIKNLEGLNKHMVSCYPQEGVGYITEGMFVPLENIHPDPVDSFLISESASFWLLQRDYILIHSHCMESFAEDPRIPSLADMQGQKDTDKLWGIVHCDGENVSDVLYFGKPSEASLLGRKYIRNAFDCFSLVRDYYHPKGIESPTYPRPANWEEWNPYYLLEGLEKINFIEIDKSEMVEGDLLVFRVRSPQPNHLGIYLGEDKFIHHLFNRLSCEDDLSKWKSQFIKVLRFTK